MPTDWVGVSDAAAALDGPACWSPPACRARWSRAAWFLLKPGNASPQRCRLPLLLPDRRALQRRQQRQQATQRLERSAVKAWKWSLPPVLAFSWPARLLRLQGQACKPVQLLS
jgi:hypothetical protein